MKPFKNLETAKKQARSMAKLRGNDWFVIREDGWYHVADEYDLDTFFLGIPDHDIVYCSAE